MDSVFPGTRRAYGSRSLLPLRYGPIQPPNNVRSQYEDDVYLYCLLCCFQYAELRRRMATFNENFTGLFLLGLLEERGGSIITSGGLSKWIESAAGLSDWLLQPQRLHQYADIVEPYLLGLSKVG